MILQQHTRYLESSLCESAKYLLDYRERLLLLARRDLERRARAQGLSPPHFISLDSSLSHPPRKAQEELQADAMNFGKLLNEPEPAAGDGPSQDQPARQDNSSLQGLLDVSAIVQAVQQPQSAPSTSHDFAERAQEPAQQNATPAPARAPHFTSYGQHEAEAASTVPVAPAPAFGAFDLLSAAAQHALDPSSADAYLAQLNQPSLPAAEVGATGLALQQHAATSNGATSASGQRNLVAGSQLSPSSSIKLVPDSDEDAEGEQDEDAEGEDEDVLMQDQSERRSSSVLTSQRARSRSVKTETEDALMDSLSFIDERGSKVQSSAGPKVRSALLSSTRLR